MKNIDKSNTYMAEMKEHIQVINNTAKRFTYALHTHNNMYIDKLNCNYKDPNLYFNVSSPVAQDYLNHTLNAELGIFILTNYPITAIICTLYRMYSIEPMRLFIKAYCYIHKIKVISIFVLLLVLIIAIYCFSTSCLL